MDHIKSYTGMWIRFNWPRRGLNGDYENNDRGNGPVARSTSPKRPDRPYGPLSLLFKGWSSFTGIKRPTREGDHSPPSTAEVKNEWSYTSAPPLRLHGADRGNHTFPYLHFYVFLLLTVRLRIKFYMKSRRHGVRFRNVPCKTKYLLR